MGIENKRLKRQRSRWQPLALKDVVIRLKTERRGIGKMKAMSIILIALLQLGLLILLHTIAVATFRGYLIFSLVMDFLTCLYVLASDKNSRSKAVWIMIILVLFPVGFVIFFLSDERVFFRSSRRRYRSIIDASSDLVAGCAINGMPETTARACNYIKNVTGYEPYKNTSAVYFPSGTGAFDDMTERCAAAEKFIFIEYFIIAEGALFTRLFGVLKERAAAGVDVRVIYDDMGSSGKLPAKLKRELRKSGIKLYAFNKLVPLYKIAMNYRDHRKITVIDGKTAYTGGINISDEYVNERRLYGYWKDNAVRIDGEAVQGFTLMFLRQWEFVTRKTFDYSPFLYAAARPVPPESENSSDIETSVASADNALSATVTDIEQNSVAAYTASAEPLSYSANGEQAEPLSDAAKEDADTALTAAEGKTENNSAAEGECVAEADKNCAENDGVTASAAGKNVRNGGVFLPFASGLEYRAPVARDVYAGVISQSAERLWIMTPYFVPDDTITNLLASKALSGVDVRIVLPGVPDKSFVYLISLDNADKLIKSGVKVYTMTDAFVHTKSVLSEKCAVIGSANFDLRSFYQQYENALYTDDAVVMEGLKADFEQTFPECACRNFSDVQPGPIRALFTALLQIFAPLM